MIKYCNKCREEKREECPSGYSFWWNDKVSICPYDKNVMQNIEFDAKDLSIISEISEEYSFIQAMIDLRKSDPIEYQLKMSQFKANLTQQKIGDQKIDSKPHCPTCGSTNIEKISATSKVVGAVAFGLFSKTAKSQFKCKNCGAKW